MFRAERKAGSPLGKRIGDILARGELVGDDVVNELVANRIAASDCARGFLLDGYPRTVAQAKYFADLLRSRKLSEPRVIHLDVRSEVLVKRLTARRQCPKCCHIYNLLSQPPARDGVCDQDGTPLITREDDREAVIRDRLRAYECQTGPILDWFGRSRVIRIDGALPPADVTAAIDEALAQPLVPASGR